MNNSVLKPIISDAIIYKLTLDWIIILHIKVASSVNMVVDCEPLLRDYNHVVRNILWIEIFVIIDTVMKWDNLVIDN